MKISEIVKGTDVSSRIVKFRHSRSGRRRADLLATITQAAEELRGLSRGTRVSEGVDINAELDALVHAAKRLKKTLSSKQTL